MDSRREQTRLRITPSSRVPFEQPGLSHPGPAAGRCHPKRAGAERPANHTVFKGPSSITQDLPSGEAVPSSNQVMDSQGTSTRGFEAAPFRTPGQLQAAATRSGREQSGLRIAPSSRGPSHKTFHRERRFPLRIRSWILKEPQREVLKQPPLPSGEAVCEFPLQGGARGLGTFRRGGSLIESGWILKGAPFRCACPSESSIGRGGYSLFESGHTFPRNFIARFSSSPLSHAGGTRGPL